MHGIIRRTKQSDIDKIYKIELSQSISPWKKEFFADEISNDFSNFFVLENFINNEIMGFIIFWIIDDFAELHSIVISEKYKRKGNASLLIDYMLDYLIEKKIKEIFLEVRESNTNAINLYKKYSFKEINKRENYYKNPPETAIILNRNI